MTTLHSVRTGHIDWIELTSPDPTDALTYYREVLGWEYTPVGDETLAEVDGRKTAGITSNRPTIGDMPLPAAWTVVFRVEDVDETVQRVGELGGDVIEPPADHVEGWRSAIVRDPSGAVFSVVQASADYGRDVSDRPGSFTSADLLTMDTGRAIDFYRDLMGWTTALDADSGHTAFTLHGDTVAGLVEMPPDMPGEVSSQWLPYFLADSVEDRVDKAIGAGGTLAVPPRSIDATRFAVVEDPQGAVFGLLEVVPGEPSIESARQAAVRLLRLANRRHIVVSDRDGRRVVEMPVSIGLVGAAVAPWAVATGAVAALAARWSLTVTEGESEH